MSDDVELMDLDAPVSQAAFGRLVGITHQSVSNMVGRGVLAPNMALRDMLIAYCARLREEAAGRNLPTQERLNEARIRDLTISADAKEQEFWVRSRQLVIAEDVERLMAAWASRAANEMRFATERIIEAVESAHGVTLEQELIDGCVKPAFRAIHDVPAELIDNSDAGSRELATAQETATA